MFDTSWLVDLDAAGACAAVTATQAAMREVEWRELAIAGHWAVLHGPDPEDPPMSLESQIRRFIGGHGTPEVEEFAAAELGVLMETGSMAAVCLIRDALDLQHRHPRLWEALAQGRGRVWKARKVATLAHVAGLSRDQARWVDEATTPYLDTLTTAAYLRLVEARIIEADPAAAEARRLAAGLERFVVTGQTNEHGLKTLIAKATAGDVIYFVAVCDRVAQLLQLEGDTDPVDIRRSKALAYLANPALALALLEKHTTDAAHPDDPDPHPDQPEGTGQRDGTDQHPGTDQQHGSDPAEAEAGSGDVQDTSAAAASPAPASASASASQAAPAQASTWGNTCGSCGGPRIDPDRLRPRAVLYVRVTEDALRSRTGVANCESGVGPVTVQAIKDLLGHHRVTVRPVLTLAGQAPVDAYEIPHDMREALRLARPGSVFPWSQTGTSTPDVDHTTAYLPIDKGGPPGQTTIDNLGPMTRTGHRVKTHARGWAHHQPRPGVYLWRSRHGHWYQVDNDGTHPLGRHDPRHPPDSSHPRDPPA